MLQHPNSLVGLWPCHWQIGRGRLVKAACQAVLDLTQPTYLPHASGVLLQVTALSGYLYKFPKDERRTKLQEALAQFQPPRQDLYLPTNPEARVKGHIPSSGACMQSAAKVGGRAQLMQ